MSSSRRNPSVIRLLVEISAASTLIGDLVSADIVIPRALGRNLEYIGEFNLRRLTEDGPVPLKATLDSTRPLLFSRVHDVEGDARTPAIRNYVISLELALDHLDRERSESGWELSSPEESRTDGETLLFLLEESKIIDLRARRFQSDETGRLLSDMSVKRVRDDYQDWYTDVLAFLHDTDREAPFRQQYEGGNWTSRIREYLGSPRSENPLSKGQSPEAQELFGVWQYPFDRCFSKPFSEQVLILRERWKLSRSNSMRERESSEIKDPLVSSRSESGRKTAFISHGSSLLYLRLKDFVSDRLLLEPSFFEKDVHLTEGNFDIFESYANRSDVAFVLLTQDDKTATGDLRPRQNVIHELGFLQGRLGREKVIVLRQDGVEELSNLAGVQEVRFPANNIDAAYEQIRRYLEKMGVVSA